MSNRNGYIDSFGVILGLAIAGVVVGLVGCVHWEFSAKQELLKQLHGIEVSKWQAGFVTVGVDHNSVKAVISQ
tara:strand:+ start:1704 stop:1922 length:219 start_codon:yes stop_codon:yes gene_type:complete